MSRIGVEVCTPAYQKEWQRRYKEKHGISSTTAFRRRNPEAAKKHREREKQRWREDPTIAQRHAVVTRHERRRIKIETFDAYGGAVCICCGEQNELFLTLDHIYNDGAEERRQLKHKGSGIAFYRWLRLRRYPHGYQVMCYNCNCGKRMNGGICPHQGVAE